MLSFNISCHGKLPNLGGWLQPDYGGPGDSIVRPDRDQPGEWQTDYPDYDWKVDALQALKICLNKTKHLLDPMCNNRKFQVVCELSRSHESLRTDRGIIVRNYGGEICTNAWLKMYELCGLLRPMLTERDTRRERDFRTLSLAEAPGNFILAINHYLRSNHKVDWTWFANTYKGIGQDKYLDDNYGIIKAYPESWLFGADGDGDITSESNIRSIAFKLSNTRIDCVTSDVKYVPAEENYDEEENINGPVQLGAILGSLTCLSKGGTAILKQFTIFEAHSISWLWLLNCLFKELTIVKPETSKAANSEIYVVCTGFKDHVALDQMEILYRQMQYIRSLNDGRRIPALFKRTDIPDEFIIKIVELQTLLVDQQCASIEQNIKLWTKYKDLPPSRIAAQNATERDHVAREWLGRNNIKPLPANHRVLRD